MKATGIVRKIDNLGRVVIPKEIREDMKIDNGNTLEIFVDQDESVILKKYSPVEELDQIQDYIDTLVKTTECEVIISDSDKVIGSSSAMEKYVGRSVGPGVKEAMASRKTTLIKSATEEDVCLECDKKEQCELGSVLISPIMKQGDVLGAVMISSAEKELGEFENKVADTTAKILSKKLGL